jgi:hypothetical protein
MALAEANYLGLVSIPASASLLLPWSSIRAWGVSIDIFPSGVGAWSVTEYDSDWVVDRLLALDDAFSTVCLLVVASIIPIVAGSSKLPSLLIAPVALNSAAALLFYRLMRFAIGKLVHGYFSGTQIG